MSYLRFNTRKKHCSIGIKMGCSKKKKKGCSGNSERNDFRGVVVVQSLSCVKLFVTPWTAARQVSLSFAIS